MDHHNSKDYRRIRKSLINQTNLTLHRRALTLIALRHCSSLLSWLNRALGACKWGLPFAALSWQIGLRGGLLDYWLHAQSTTQLPAMTLSMGIQWKDMRYTSSRAVRWYKKCVKGLEAHGRCGESMSKHENVTRIVINKTSARIEQNWTKEQVCILGVFSLIWTVVKVSIDMDFCPA